MKTDDLLTNPTFRAKMLHKMNLFTSQPVGIDLTICAKLGSNATSNFTIIRQKHEVCIMSQQNEKCSTLRAGYLGGLLTPHTGTDPGFKEVGVKQ